MQKHFVRTIFFGLHPKSSFGNLTRCIESYMELKDLIIPICLRKTKVSAERISVLDIIEKLVEHGIQSWHTLYAILILINYHSKQEFILMSKHQDIILPRYLVIP